MLTKQVATRFRRTKPEKVQPLLNALTDLTLLRETDEGGYLGINTWNDQSTFLYKFVDYNRQIYINLSIKV